VFAHPRLVRRRRVKRRLKAAASVLVALAAGTFLACQRHIEQLVADAGGGPASDGSSDAPPDAPESVGIDVRSVDGSPVDADAALVKVADARSPRPRDAAVDVKEHRKGMPVPDNLLE
jgi:hypothetical protein